MERTDQDSTNAKSLANKQYLIELLGEEVYNLINEDDDWDEQNQYNEGGLQTDGTLSEFEKEPVFEKFVTDKESNLTYKIHKYLGKGGFGVIRSAYHIESDELVALKFLDKSKIADLDAIDRICNEINLLKIAKHPYIIRLYQVLEDDDNIVLSMEYWANGDLMDYVHRRKRL